MYTCIRLNMKPNSVRIRYLSWQIFVLPSMRFALTPLIHCGTNRLALCPVHYATSTIYIYLYKVTFNECQSVFLLLYCSITIFLTKLDFTLWAISIDWYKYQHCVGIVVFNAICFFFIFVLIFCILSFFLTISYLHFLIFVFRILIFFHSVLHSFFVDFAIPLKKNIDSDIWRQL
jgi:hypothetical protein